ncbi:efflux RND transporter periplasmic adaptor subunit [Spongiimicrobium sp. 3-5]|uniref:efflux RND transporter periplasmic adaptor subunit n=1 Tax=Spongiimicrobium sp. 3-5 TaxID=3332596 RepID=UPI00397F56C8
MKHINSLIAPLILLFTFVSCGENNKEEKKIVRPVSYQEIGYLGSENTRTFSGTSKTDEVVNLTFRSGGIITAFDIKLGQKVKKGQQLSRLDNVQSRLNYENAISSLNSAASQMNTAKLALDRVRSLYEKGSAALSDYESAKNSFLTAKASHESALRSVAIQQDQVSYGYLHAPADGTIAAVNAEINENVTAGQIIAVLNVSGDMEISLGLPESIINNVNQGMPVALSFSSLSGQEFKGRVSEVAPSVDGNTSTYPVRIIIIDPTDDIKSGMAANVTFNFGNGAADKKVLVAPAKSVGEDDKGNFVFVIESDDGKTGTAKKQTVTIGNLTSEGFEIIDGLNVGQKIATAGLQTLLNGQKIRLQ